MKHEVIKIGEVKNLLGVRSDATVYCKINPNYPERYDPSFPRPFKIGGGTFWKKSDVEDWINEQIIKNRL